MNDDVTTHAASAAARKLYRAQIEPQIEESIKKSTTPRAERFSAAFYAVVAEEVVEAMRAARCSYREDSPAPEIAAEHALAEIAEAKRCLLTAAHILRRDSLAGETHAFQLAEQIDALGREVAEGIADFQRSAALMIAEQSNA